MIINKLCCGLLCKMVTESDLVHPQNGCHKGHKIKKHNLPQCYLHVNPFPERSLLSSLINLVLFQSRSAEGKSTTDISQTLGIHLRPRG